MPEVTIKYSSNKSLQALKDFAKYFDIKISMPKAKKQKDKEDVIIKGTGVTDDTINELRTIFSDNNMDAKKLRKSWQKGK